MRITPTNGIDSLADKQRQGGLGSDVEVPGAAEESIDKSGYCVWFPEKSKLSSPSYVRSGETKSHPPAAANKPVVGSSLASDVAYDIDCGIKI